MMDNRTDAQRAHDLHRAANGDNITEADDD